MFVTKKNINGQDYYYLQKSVREGKQVRSEYIAYLGKDKTEAEAKAEQIKNQLQNNSVENPAITFEKPKQISVEELAMFCKRKGFVYPSGEIYGGQAGFWDLGHLGVELVNNIKKEWWKFHVQERDDFVGIDGAIITNPKVWEASGHVASFVEFAVKCKKCGYKTKVDKSELATAKCDKCKSEYENKGEFNPMFTTQVGPIKEEAVISYLRPETAQLIFANFKFIQENARLKLPFGVAQIGKSFRNELSPREFLFRSREFEQMEIEYFIAPDQPCPYMEETKAINITIFDEQMQKENKEPQLMNIFEAWRNKIIPTDWHAYWIAKEFEWFISLGANPFNFRARQHTANERSHYSKDTWDFEYNFPMGWKELQGFANRGDFDLSQHQKFSKTNMEIEHEGKKVLPHVVCEPSVGVGRATMVFMLDSYFVDDKRQNTVLKIHPKLAPIKAAVFPIIKEEQYEKIAEEIVKDLKKEFMCVYDRSGSIGRRYARNDEQGTPYCITVDDKSPQDQEVTIRDRDTTHQIRIKIKDVKSTLKKLINQEIDFDKAGKIVQTRIKEE